MPTFAAGLIFSWTADLIALIALLASARFFLALAGMDVGTSFGGIGSSREGMIASLAEPAMLLIVFTLALVAGSTQLSTVAGYMASPAVGLRVSLGLALIALIMVMGTGTLSVCVALAVTSWQPAALASPTRSGGISRVCLSKAGCE